MTRHEIRYMFEHRLIPQWIHEEGTTFVAMLLQDKGLLYRIINDIFEKEGVENPYREEQFQVESGKAAEDVMMVKICFPEPEDEPLCYCGYLFLDKEFEKVSYVVIERGNSFGKELPFVCVWEFEDGGPMHVNYGNCEKDGQDDFVRAMDVYMRKWYGQGERVYENRC